MTQAPSLDAALARLSRALSGLEDAAERQIEAERRFAARAAEVQALSDDRARLAGELDEAFARAARLEAANREVSERLGTAAAAISGLLAAERA